MTYNSEGIEFCLKKRVKWMTDIFGKTPLDYALKTGDRPIIETIMKGIFEMDPFDR
jgi:hypothetical protein